MKQRVLKYLGILLILVSLMSFIKPKKWFLLNSEQHNYTIEFPSEPTENNQVLNTEIGELKMNMYMLDTSENGIDDNLTYMVINTEYPSELVNSDNTEDLEGYFRGAIDGAIANVHGKLLSEKIIQLDEYSGREVRVDFRDGLAIITMRAYLVKNKMYILQTITETKKDFNKSRSRFLDSFKLTNNTKVKISN